MLAFLFTGALLMTAAAPADVPALTAETTISCQGNEATDLDEATIWTSNRQRNKKYYVTGRYFCKAKRDNSKAGDCTVTTWHADSCSAACQAHKEDIQSRGDVCKHCTDNITDNTKYYSGEMEWTQGGPCRSYDC